MRLKTGIGCSVPSAWTNVDQSTGTSARQRLSTCRKWHIRTWGTSISSSLTHRSQSHKLVGFKRSMKIQWLAVEPREINTGKDRRGRRVSCLAESLHQSGRSKWCILSSRRMLCRAPQRSQCLHIRDIFPQLTVRDLEIAKFNGEWNR